MTATVAVVIPTFRRNEGLALAVRSVFAQQSCGDFELVIVDNDPEGGAKACAEDLAHKAPPHVALSYVHEPNPGVANARNLALASTNARLIAFLDDDQSATPHWLSSLLEAHRQFPASVTFGPIDTLLPEQTRHHRTYFSRFFERHEPIPTGYMTHAYGCGNSLLDLDLLPATRPLFDAAMNEIGGEDDMLFRSVRQTGGTFAWAAEALAYEHVPVERAQLSYTLKRALSYGQGPITLARKQVPPDYLRIVFWMGVGLYKMVVNAIVYSLLWVLRSERRALYLDRAARGAGKLLWWHELRFYGASRLGGTSP
ncbi:MAG TPA: glycosyltransferase family 2 protein [Hyphomonas sp.]|nr:glycosyltransferase family 2 protein [Hyphomonas sp.]MCB9961302.1 glycosyltransferase family 2 protein [Hyphomonas sp.]MCB9971477.1 glycosyltransferase family 2 protein [Hyphomonas sp.]HPE47058.1 glycosyltransferase family 2 protein [Hyphomonas sp.]